MSTKDYPYRISAWLPGSGKSNSLFERGSWIEMARCSSSGKASEVATCLSLRNSNVRLEEWQGDEESGQFVAYRYLPESARSLVSGQS